MQHLPRLRGRHKLGWVEEIMDEIFHTLQSFLVRQRLAAFLARHGDTLVLQSHN